MRCLNSGVTAGDHPEVEEVLAAGRDEAAIGPPRGARDRIQTVCSTLLWVDLINGPLSPLKTAGTALGFRLDEA